MSAKFRRVSLLGAFEIQAEVQPPVRDGLILGSRRERKGFVIETSRESIEHLVAIIAPVKPGLPKRLAGTVGPMLVGLGFELLRVELIPLPTAPEVIEEGYGAFVQGWLVFRNGMRRLHRLPMTATESIQVAIAEGVPILAADELLQLDVAHFLEEIDSVSHQHHQEASNFRSFVDNVTATDFTRFYETRKDRGDERGSGN